MPSIRLSRLRLDDLLALLFSSLLLLFFAAHPGSIPTGPFLNFFGFLFYYGLAFLWGRWTLSGGRSIPRLFLFGATLAVLGAFSLGTVDTLGLEELRMCLLLLLPLAVGGWASFRLEQGAGGGVRAIQVVRDFLPFLISQGAYLLLHEVVHQVNPVDRDPLLIKIDQTIFGVALTQVLEPFVSPLWTEWFSANYALFLILQFFLALVLVGKRERIGLHHLLLAIVICNYVGYLGYLCVPAIGPMYTLHYEVPLSGGWFYTLKESLDELARVPRDCFPSLHTANTLVVLLITWRYVPRLLPPLLVLGGSCILATIYLRYHYTVDVVAGFLLGGGVFLAVPPLARLWQRAVGGSAPVETS